MLAFLDSPVYVVVFILCGILICAFIGYLGEKYINKKKEEQVKKSQQVDALSNVSSVAFVQDAASSSGAQVASAQSATANVVAPTVVINNTGQITDHTGGQVIATDSGATTVIGQTTTASAGNQTLDP